MYAVGKLYSLWKIYSAEIRQAHCLVSYGASTTVAMSGHVVYGVEGDGSGLCRSYETDP